MKRKLFVHNKPLIGIDISYTYLKVMTINMSKWSVACYGSITIDPLKAHESLTGNPEYLSEKLKELVAKNIIGRVPSDHAVICIPTNLTYNRSTSLPVEASKKMAEAVSLEAEQSIPVPGKELNMTYEVLEKTKESVEVSISAVPKKIVDNVVSICDAAGFYPMLVQPSISSVARLITLTEQGQLPTLVVDIGAATTDLAILSHGKIRANASVQIGDNAFTNAISKALKTSLENAHQLKVTDGLAYSKKQASITKALAPSLKQIVDEIHKILRYNSERLGSTEKIEQVIVVGSGSNMPGLGEYFTDTLIMPARVGSPWQNLNFGSLQQPARQFKARYISVAGVASITPKELTL